VLVGQVEGHGVSDEVAGAGLEAELFVNLLHAAVVDVETCLHRQHFYQAMTSMVRPRETNPCEWRDLWDRMFRPTR
jgi:hypothetical protein